MGVSLKERLFHAGVVNTQELVLGGGHVDEIRLAFGPFLVQELVHWLVSGCLEQIGADDLVERLAQVRRTPLGGWIALGDMLAGFVHCRIDAGETHDGAAAGETAHVTNLSHQLRSGSLTHAVHGSNGFVLRQLPGQTIHLSAQDSQRSLSRGQLLGSGGDDQLDIAVLGQGRNMPDAVDVQIRRFGVAEMITLPLAPLAVTLRESSLADQGDALTVPEGHDEIHSLLASVGTIRTGKYLVYPRKNLVSERNEVILQGHHVLHVQIVLP